MMNLSFHKIEKKSCYVCSVYDKQANKLPFQIKYSDSHQQKNLEKFEKSLYIFCFNLLSIK